MRVPKGGSLVTFMITTYVHDLSCGDHVVKVWGWDNGERF